MSSSRYAGSPEREQTYSIEQTMDGGYITTGFRDFGSVTAPAEDVIITKHFPDGSIEWQRIWEGPGRDIGYSVQQTFDGGYIVAAESTSSPDPSAQTLLIRLDPIGNPVWQNFYFGTFQTDPIHAEHPGVAIDQGFNGQIYLVSDLFARPMILAVDPSGALIWNAVYSDPVGIPSVAAQFAFTDIKHDPTNGTLVVSGTTQRNEPTPPSARRCSPRTRFSSASAIRGHPSGSGTTTSRSISIHRASPATTSARRATGSTSRPRAASS